MKDRSEQNTKPEKKPYVKPEVKQVELRPEEAVLGNCKAVGTTSAPGVNCGGCPVSVCSTCGS